MSPRPEITHTHIYSDVVVAVVLEDTTRTQQTNTRPARKRRAVLKVGGSAFAVQFHRKHSTESSSSSARELITTNVYASSHPSSSNVPQTTQQHAAGPVETYSNFAP